MKGDNPYVMRALYIILVPLVLLTILLNSGWLQRLFPAASVHGETYSVVRYNFYYYSCFNRFLEENEGRLDSQGFDAQRSPGQQVRSDGLTWKEYFQRQAEEELAQTAYYCDLAQAAGYEFSPEELAPVEEELARHDALRTAYNVSANNYYVSYYGAGMSQEAFTQELTRKVQAQAYRAYLLESTRPDQAEVDSWLAGHNESDYRTASLRVITLEALPDRATGAVGPDQLSALAEQLARLAERYEAGVPFEELQTAFSTCALGDESGALTAVSPEGLPRALADWCLTGQDARTPGETCSVVDEESGVACFAVLDGFGGSGAELAAEQALAAQAVTAQEEAALPAYQVERSRLGMMLAAA